MRSPRKILLSFFHAPGSLSHKGISRPEIHFREVVSYILAFTLAVVMVGVFLRWHIASLYEEEMASWQARESSTAADRARMVSDWLKERQGDARVFASRSAVRANLRAYYDAGQVPNLPLNSQPELTPVLDEMAKWYSYAGVYILDRDGQVVMQSSRSILLNPSFSDTCRAVSRSGVMEIALVWDVSNRSLMGFCAPVFPAPPGTNAGRPPGQLLGSVLVVSDASQTLFSLLTREIAPTRTGETLLVRREGNDIVCFSPLRDVAAGASPQLRMPLATASTPARLALEGRETFGEYNDYRGVPVLAATQLIPLTGWGLVRKIDRAEAMQDFRRMAIAEGMAGGVLVILLGGLLMFHRRNVMARVLKQEEEKFRALLESAPDAIYINEPITLRILRRNRRAADLDGYSDEDIARMTARDLHPPEDHILVRDSIDKGSETGRPLPIRILHYRTKNGQLVPVEESQTLVNTGGEELLLSIVRDITERERGEQELRRVNRALQTISECNRALVRAVDEPHLLEDICGILVRTGGFRMAWVGYGEQDEDKSVRPVAHAGFQEGYLHTACITWADTERGWGPTGTAIRTGQMVVARNIEADPSLAPWRQEALKQGYVSSIALPILSNGHVFGALSIYSEEPDAFDPKEMQLLKELSDDLAYGINALRTRAERTRAEEAVLQSEERFRTLFENVLIGIYRTTPDGHVLAGNPAFVRMLGYKSFQELAARNLNASAFEPAYPRSQFMELLEKRGEITGLESAWHKQNGDVLHVRENVRAIRDHSGNVLYYEGTAEDITERKRAEAEHVRLVTAIEQSEEAVVITNTKGDIEYVNPAFTRITGYRREEVLGQNPRILKSGKQDPALYQQLWETVLKGQTWHGELINQRRDGNLYREEMTITPVRDRSGVVTSFIAIMQDTTERRRAEEALRESEERFRTAFEEAPLGMCLTALDGRFLQVNAALCQMLGYSKQELLEGAWQKLTHPDDLERSRQTVDQLSRGLVSSLGLEKRYLHKNGSAIWVQLKISVVKNTDGSAAHFITHIEDITFHKRAEEELLFKTALLEAQSETTIDGIMAVDSTGKILLTNRQFAEMWNLPAKLIATKDSRKVAEHVLARLKGPDAFLRKVNFLFEHQSEKSLDEIEFKDGRVFDRYSSPLNDSTGKPHGRVLYFRDITERKRAEQAIQESQSRLQIIFDSVQTGIVIIDPETRRIVDVNPVALEMIGAPRDEVVGAECHKVICPAERGRCPVCDLGQSVDNSERILLTASGGRREVIKTVVPVVIGGRQHLLESFIDITQHKRAEAEQIRLVTAIEQSAEAVVITNTNGDIEYVNPAFTRITGYSREEVLGQNPRVLKSGKQDVALYQQLWETILRGEAWHGELINQRKDGSLYTEEMNITPVRVTRGEVTHFIASIQDVTERKSLEGHLQQAAKMEAVGRLAGGVAHDFNNLLTIINGYTELLLGKFASDSKVSVHLKEIEKAGERAASLTRQLLAFSRRQVLAPQVLDLNVVVSNLEKMLRRLIGEDITLRTLLDPSLGKVKADPGQIEQVIMNLAVNARDAMPSGGNLTIETSNVELDEAYARTHATVKPGPHVMLAVADTGLGMTPETKARIFEPFFTTKEKGKGTGLGLATVYGIVKQSGGSIWVYSEVGQGTIFKIYLPIVSESPEAREPAKAAMDSAAGSETILVVEDEEGVRSLIRLALESTGYKVLEMEDGESALGICANHHGPIHLMLTDVVMPQMSGALLAEKVISMRPDIKIVFMSGYTDDAIVRHGVLSHQMPFLQKPFSGVAVCKKIREVLDGK